MTSLVGSQYLYIMHEPDLKFIKGRCSNVIFDLNGLHITLLGRLAYYNGSRNTLYTWFQRLQFEPNYETSHNLTLPDRINPYAT